MNLSIAIGWVLALAAVVAGHRYYGWPGVLLAVGMVVFWLLLQFSRAMRAMRDAAGAPIGHVASAVMVQSRLRQGMRLPAVVGLTRSLGEKLADDPETFCWRDNSGASVSVRLVNGRVVGWDLSRDASEAAAAEPVAPPNAAPPGSDAAANARGGQSPAA